MKTDGDRGVTCVYSLEQGVTGKGCREARKSSQHTDHHHDHDHDGADGEEEQLRR